MGKPINVYWAVANEGQDVDWQLMMEEPAPLRKSLYEKRNRSNKDRQTYLKCPAVTAVINNTLVWRSPKNTSVDIPVENGEIELYRRHDKGDMFHWYPEHQPAVSNNLLITFDYHIIFFADQDVEVLFSAPYFSKAPHLQYGAIVPGKFNVGSWFRPYNAEMNLWEGNRHMEFQENEPIAYFTFLTDEKINVHQFRMTDDLRKISYSMTSSGTWLPYKPLQDRYNMFRQRKMRETVLDKINANIV
jgi:hypothetical protein